MVTDEEYSNDLAPFKDTCADEEVLVQVLEITAKEIGLCINNKKTECMLRNHKGIVKSINSNTIKQVENSRYLGSEISSTAKYVYIKNW